MSDFIDHAIKYGAVACGLASFLLTLIVNCFNGKEHNLQDLLVVGVTGSSVPTGLLLMVGAFDKNVLRQLIESNLANVYIALAGAGMVFVFYQTLREKIQRQTQSIHTNDR